MPTYDYVIKQGDTVPALQLQMKDINGNPVDLTDNVPSVVQSMEFHMRPKSSQFSTFTTGNILFNDLSVGLVTVEFNEGGNTTQLAPGEYEAIMIVKYEGNNVQETFPKFGSFNIYIDSDMSQGTGDIVYTPEFITYDEVRIITGESVSPAILQQAEIIIEQALGMTYEEIDEEGISLSDAKWIRNAIAYQAAWLSKQITPYAVSDVNAIGSGSSQVELNDTALIRSRFVVDALSKISWLQANQTLVVDSYRNRRYGYYDDDAGVAVTPWRPLRGI